MIGHGRRVGEPRIDYDELGPIHHPFQNPLCMRIEVVPSLQM